MKNSHIRSRHKFIAAFFLNLMVFQLAAPITASAITGGPTQPETMQFQSISASNMVDLATGDFSYSIPLFDMGGYPVTMSYSANNTGIEDEATNLGLGWNINIGSINRQLRGVPDDFKGDNLSKKMYQNPLETVEVGAKVDLEILGGPLGLGFGAGQTIGWSNYWGYYGKLSLKSSLSAMGSAGRLTVGMGLESGGRDGVSLNPFVSMSTNLVRSEMVSDNLGLSSSASYNTRQGLKSISFGASYAIGDIHTSGNATLSFAGPVYYPQIDWPRKTTNYFLDLSAGPTLWPIQFKGALRGSYSKQELAVNQLSIPMFGTLYSSMGKNDPAAMLDFSREKDGVLNPNTPNLPVPVYAPDIFSVSNHFGSSQFTLKSGTPGIFYDPASQSDNDTYSGGFEFGFGPGSVKFGGNVGITVAETRIGKWVVGNDFNKVGNYYGNNITSDKSFESVYGRKVGNYSVLDANYYNQLGGDKPVMVKLSKHGKAYKAQQGFVEKKDLSPQTLITSQVKRNSREGRDQDVLLLTAGEASNYPGNAKLKSYEINKPAVANCFQPDVLEISRVDGSTRKSHHLSEIRVTNPDGKRMVYGIPAYNLTQKDVTFSVPKADATNPTIAKHNLVSYKKSDAGPGNSQNRERMFKQDITPSYAHSFLLTEILSADYVDLTGDGVTDDDNGEGIRFNYSRSASNYGWRLPFLPQSQHANGLFPGSGAENPTFGEQTGFANYQEGFKSDEKDDRAFYSYGEKELWNIHSIESKSYYALFIYDSRTDMWGIQSTSDEPGQQWAFDQKCLKLKEIRLYSKEEIKKANGIVGVDPIKTVHLSHGYTNDRYIPNTSGGKGKLLLTKVQFTYGSSSKGMWAPYEFNYNPESIDYTFKAQDRWGSYKSYTSNPAQLPNWEYPYAIQDKTVADQNISLWKLQEIELPSGGSIKIEYESDDYAYVQNRRAMRMFPVSGIGENLSNTGLINANKIYVPVEVEPGFTKESFLEGVDFLHYKMFVNLDGKGAHEYVQGYAKINYGASDLINGNILEIVFDMDPDGFNPITKTAWQMMRESLPQLAYDYYDNSKVGIDGIMTGMAGSFKALGELVTSFTEKATGDPSFANTVDLSKSFVRLCEPKYKKLGGGHRVQKIIMDDHWSSMTSSAISSKQTIEYDYRMDIRAADGSTITGSSGVASYEPMIGNEENPFRQPVVYNEKVPMRVDNIYTLEQPFGESYFPAPSIAYQQVKVTMRGDDGENTTGYTLNEFYTAKQFPTVARQTGLDRKDYSPSFSLKVLNINLHRTVGASQGYYIELNDMHGKPKSVQVFDKGNARTSSTHYYYKSDAVGQDDQRLNNEVQLIKKDGNTYAAQMGVDIDMYNDMRYEDSKNDSYEQEFNSQTLFIGWIPIMINLLLNPPTYERNEFFSTTTIKVVNKTGILDRIVKMENGSTIETKNLLWDHETCEAVLSSVQNEYGAPVYNFQYPAHWAYPKMGGAYNNSGMIIAPLQTDSDGTLTGDFDLEDGDELIKIETVTAPLRFWVLKSSGNQMKLINELGEVVRNFNSNVKVFRSSYRNLFGNSVGTILSLLNPIQNGKLTVNTAARVLESSAMTFKDEWKTPLSKINTRVPCTVCPDTYLPETMSDANGDPRLCIKEVNVGPTITNYIGQGEQMGPGYGREQTDIFLTYGTNGKGTAITDDDSFWYGIVDRMTIWNSTTNFSQPFELQVPIRIPETGTYYIAGIGDHTFGIRLSGQLIFHRSDDEDQNNYERLHIYPLNLTKGIHTFTFFGENDNRGAAAIGFEIYKNTLGELSSAVWPNQLNVIFSTGAMVGQSIGHYSSQSNLGSVYAVFDSKLQATYKFTEIHSVHLDGLYCYECQTYEGKSINPFMAGIRSNWRPYQNWVFKENRTQPVDETNGLNKTDIKNNGYLISFSPFWTSSFSPSTNGWVKATETTLYDLKGNGLESKNALNQYSSAQYGFNSSLPVAIGSNMSANDMCYEGFEEAVFSDPSCKIPDVCNDLGGALQVKKLMKEKSTILSIDNTVSHTGLNSFKVKGMFETSVELKYSDPGSMYSFDASGQMLLQPGGINWGFAPVMAKDDKYILSAWVKDEVANRSGNEPSVNFDLKKNSSYLDRVERWGPVIDGWRRVELTFTNKESSPSNGDKFGLVVSNVNAEINIDDVRLHPAKGQMKCFAYNPKNLKLAAELDENNYSTFYEYDDEGNLMRVKKETEKGIVTLKENRSMQRKKPLEP